MRARCRVPPNIKCDACGREGHMRKVCRQQKMIRFGRPTGKQPKPMSGNRAAVAAGETSTEEGEASWSAALQAGVRLVDVTKPATALPIAAPVMTCSPTATTAHEHIDCNEQQCDATEFEICDANQQRGCRHDMARRQTEAACEPADEYTIAWIPVRLRANATDQKTAQQGQELNRYFGYIKLLEAELWRGINQTTFARDALEVSVTRLTPPTAQWMERDEREGQPYRNLQNDTVLTSGGQRAVFTIKQRKSAGAVRMKRCQLHQQLMQYLMDRSGLTSSQQFIIAVPHKTPQCQERRTINARRVEATAIPPFARRLEESKVLPDGLTLCEPPIGGGHLVALPPLPQCHKAMGPPIENVTIRLLARRHNTLKGELFAM